MRTRFHFVFLLSLLFLILVTIGFTYDTFRPQASSQPSSRPTQLTVRLANDDVILDWKRGTGGRPFTYYVYQGATQNGQFQKINSRRIRQTAYRHVDGLEKVSSSWYKVSAVTKINGKLVESPATNVFEVTRNAVGTTPIDPPPDDTEEDGPPVATDGPTYYVSGTGSDSNNTCENRALPCRQVRHAITKVTAGTGATILIGDNATYDGFSVLNFGQNLTSNEAQTRPLTIRGEGQNIVLNPNARDTFTIYGEQVKGLILDNIKIDNTGRNNIRILDSDYITIKNSTILGGDSACILIVRTNNILIENTTAANSADHHGIYISDNTNNVILRKNRLYNNGSAGIQINSEKLAGNRNVQSIAKNVTIEDNAIYNNGALGGGALNLLGVQDAVVKNNLIINNYAGGIVNAWYAYPTDEDLRPSGGPKNVKILHNTIAMAPSNPRRASASVRYAVSFQDSFGQNELRNNIIYHPQGKALSLDNRTKADSTLLASDSNIYKIDSTVGLYDGAQKHALTDWQGDIFSWKGNYNRQHREHDQNSDSENVASLADLFAFPSLVEKPVNGSITTANLNRYELRSDTLAQDSGDETSVTHDILGRLRSEPDLGAFELAR